MPPSEGMSSPCRPGRRSRARSRSPTRAAPGGSLCAPVPRIAPSRRRGPALPAPMRGGRRGIAMNSAATAVIDSALWGFTEVGADAQAIASWSGTGPFKIVNNYLEASGENVMFGGDGPSILNLVPADIEVRGNYFFKPLTWKVGDPSYAGVAWTVKNLFELKNAQRVLLDGNIFEHNWVGADQHGAAVLFTVR